MEQIIITKPDGTQVPLQNKQTITAIKSAVQDVALLGHDVVNITVESSCMQDYGIGDKITVFGRVYKMNRLPKVKKTGTHAFSYDLEFEGIQYDLLRATYDLTIDTTNNELQDVQADVLTGNLQRFATVLISNANRVMPAMWQLGTCPETIEDKTLMFGESDNCLSVLQTLCEEFDTEFEIEQVGGVNIIHFRKQSQIFPFTFEYGKGKGVYMLERQNVSSANIVTRLKVYGSTKNITYKYRAQRLCLPNKSKGQSYIEKPEAVAKYGIWEATKYFEDIAPSRTGIITGLVVGSVLKFVDSEMFDLNEKELDGKTTKYLLPGVSAKIHFNTGNLAGYEFDVHSYDHATKTFTLVKQTDDRGDVFPNATSPAFQFAVGNEYKLLDIALPPNYEQAAENELDTEGNTYYDQNCQPKVQYSLDMTDSFLKKLVGSGSTSNIFNVGLYIPIKDADINVNKSIRIQEFKRDLINEYKYSLTISDTASTSITNRVISDLKDIDNIIAINDLKDPARARSNWRTSRELLGMVFDPEGDYYTDKIKPESIDTIALSVGAKSMQFGLTNTVIQPNYNGNKKLIKVQGGVLTHYTIDENSARSWNLADNQTTLNTDSQAYYIYAKCERVGTAGAIIFSDEQIKVEQDPTYYHFWVGVVNSVDAELGVRSVALSYGFTMINGRFIRTGCIMSEDGRTYFDLDNNEIGGHINFKDGLISSLIHLASNGQVTAGLQGDSTKNVGMWLGGTYQQALNGLAKIIFNKDGSGHLAGGNVGWDTGGNLTIKGIIEALSGGHIGSFDIIDDDIVCKDANGVIKIRLTKNTIASLASLGSTYWETMYQTGHIEVEDVYSSDQATPIRYDKDFTTILNVNIPAATTFRVLLGTQGVHITDISGTLVYNNTSVGAKLIFENGTSAIVQNGQAVSYANKVVKIEVYYNVQLEFGVGGGSLSFIADYDCFVQRNASYTQTQIGTDGLFSYWGNTNYLYFKSNYGFELRFGTYGIRATSSGLQKMTNGTSWVTL